MPGQRVPGEGCANAAADERPDVVSSGRPIDLPDEGPVWEKQVGESPAMFARFEAYQHMGRTRSTRALAEQLGKSASYVQNLGHKYRWHQRARAWDQEQDRLFFEEMVEERKRMVRAHLSLSRGMLSKVAARLKTLDPAELTPADIARWSRELTAIQRSALGAPDKTVALEGTVTGPPLALAAIPAGASETDRRQHLERLRVEMIEALSDDGPLDPADFLDEDDGEA